MLDAWTPDNRIDDLEFRRDRSADRIVVFAPGGYSELPALDALSLLMWLTDWLGSQGWDLTVKIMRGPGRAAWD